MTKMATMYKSVFFFLLIIVVFLLGFSFFPSKQEQDVLLLKKAIEAIDEASSNNTKQVLESNDVPFTWVDSRITQDPFQMDANVKVKLTEDTTMGFHVYFQPDILFIYSSDGRQWNKADYTHPAAQELESVRNPSDFWLRRMKNVKAIHKSVDSNQLHFTVQLNPFTDDLFGVVFHDLDQANMDIWTTASPPIRMIRGELRVHFTPKVTNLHDHVLYRMDVGDYNEASPQPLPPEASAATKLK